MIPGFIIRKLISRTNVRHFYSACNKCGDMLVIHTCKSKNPCFSTSLSLFCKDNSSISTNDISACRPKIFLSQVIHSCSPRSPYVACHIDRTKIDIVNACMNCCSYVSITLCSECWMSIDKTRWRGINFLIKIK